MRLSAAALAILLVIAFVVAAAPRKDRPDPAPDHMTGSLAVRMDSPVLLVRVEGDADPVVWLVFRHEFGENAALAGLEPGAKLTVRGKAGRGGRYRYLVVSSVEPVE